MSLDYIHEGLKHWQTALSSGIGFLGVIITLLFNAYLTRRAEKRKQQFEANSLRQALIVEIEFIKEIASNTIEDESKAIGGASDFLIRPIRETHIYNENKGTLLLLTREQLMSVLKHYLFLDVVMSRVILIGVRRNVFSDVKEDWIEIKGKTSVSTYIGNMKIIVENSDSAIKALKNKPTATPSPT